MTSPSAQKGNDFESRLILPYFRDQFGRHVSRPRSGAARDLGDLAGVPGWTFELKCYADLARAVRDGLAELAVEQANAGTPYGGLIVKRRGSTDPARQLFLCELGAAVPLIRETAHWEVPA